MNSSRISSVSKGLIIVAAILLVISLLVPVWSIYLQAPQYPEGLSLQIWTNKIAGDVDVINGLNHYIGMKTLHSQDFIEFTVLPYIIIAYVVLFLLAALIGKKKWLYTVLALFILFGVVAMVDFWKWEYDYGHNLDPHAAIKVPGMVYQPPLIGFKQLLNFGAYSIPDIGGWLFVAAGVLLIAATVIEVKKTCRFKSKFAVLALLIATISISSCGNSSPISIDYNKDVCESCKMSISESHFASELITSKGRVYKFDDLACMLLFQKEHSDLTFKASYAADFLQNNNLIDVNTAFFVKHESYKSPMGGNIAAFSSEQEAEKQAQTLQTAILTWSDLSKEATMSGQTNEQHVH